MNFAEGRKETWRAPIFNLANALSVNERGQPVFGRSPERAKEALTRVFTF